MQREWSVGGAAPPKQCPTGRKDGDSGSSKARERRVGRLDGQFYAASRAKVVKAGVFGRRATFWLFCCCYCCCCCFFSSKPQLFRGKKRCSLAGPATGPANQSAEPG